MNAKTVDGDSPMTHGALLTNAISRASSGANNGDDAMLLNPLLNAFRRPALAVRNAFRITLFIDPAPWPVAGPGRPWLAWNLYDAGRGSGRHRFALLMWFGQRHVIVDRGERA